MIAQPAGLCDRFLPAACAPEPRRHSGVDQYFNRA
jgi:hypothetical protein